MTELPVICIVTSASCGHCNHMRNGGDFIKNESCKSSIPGGYCWNEPFFKNLICGENSNVPKFRVYEIHFGPINFTAENLFDKVVEFNEFLWNGNNVQRHKYRSEYIKVPEAKTPQNPEGDLRVIAVVGDKSTTGLLSFTKFLSNNIPRQIYTYIIQYPSWLFINGQNWNNSARSNNPGSEYYPLIAHVAGFNTVLKSKPGEREIYGINPTDSGKTDSILIIQKQFLAGEINPLKPATGVKTPSPVAVKISIDEECLKKGYVKPENSNTLVRMETGDICKDLGYRIVSANE